MYPPEISDFAFVTDSAYTTEQIRDMEMTILRVLKFRLGRPLPLQFLRRASKIYEVCRWEDATLVSVLLILTHSRLISGDCRAAHTGQIPPGAEHGRLRDGFLPSFHCGMCCSGTDTEDLGCWRMGEFELWVLVNQTGVLYHPAREILPLFGNDSQC